MNPAAEIPRPSPSSSSSSVQSHDKKPLPSVKLVTENAAMDFKMRIIEMKMQGKKGDEARLLEEIISNSSSLESVRKQLKQLQERERSCVLNIARIEECNALSEGMTTSITQQLNNIKISKEERTNEHQSIVKRYEAVFESHQKIYSSLPWVKEKNRLSLEVEKKRILLVRLKQARLEAAARRHQLDEIAKRRQRLQTVELSKLMVERAKKLKEMEDLTALQNNIQEEIRSLETEKKEIQDKISARTREAIQRMINRSNDKEKSPSGPSLDQIKNKACRQFQEPFGSGGARSIWDRLGINQRKDLRGIPQLPIRDSLPLTSTVGSSSLELEPAPPIPEVVSPLTAPPQSELPGPTSPPHPDLMPPDENKENTVEEETEVERAMIPEVTENELPPQPPTGLSLTQPSSVQLETFTAQQDAPEVPIRPLSLRAGLLKPPPSLAATMNPRPSYMDVVASKTGSSMPSSISARKEQEQDSRQASTAEIEVSGLVASRYLDAALDAHQLRPVDHVRRLQPAKRPQNTSGMLKATDKGEDGPNLKKMRTAADKPPSVLKHTAKAAASCTPPRTPKRVSFVPDQQESQKEKTPDIEGSKEMQEGDQVQSQVTREDTASDATQSVQPKDAESVIEAVKPAKPQQEAPVQKEAPSSSAHVPTSGNFHPFSPHPDNQPGNQPPGNSDSIFGALFSSPEAIPGTEGFQFSLGPGGQQPNSNQGQSDPQGTLNQDFFSFLSIPPTNNNQKSTSNDFFSLF